MNFDRMRALLLEQAIRGELVPQLDSEGVVEQMRDAPEEIPFEIPEKWKWASLKVLVERTKQTIPEEEFTYIDVASIENFQVRATKKVKASEAPSRARKIAEAGMVLFATVRPYLKNICIVPNIEGSVIASTAFATMICTKHLDNKYLLYVLRSDFFTDLVKGKQRGISYPAISDKDFYSLSIPVPPIEEQKRIVAKLEKVFVEIDRAEKAYQELQTLSDALTKQILQKAIHGRLVPQLKGESLPSGIKEVKDSSFEIPETWRLTSLGDLISMKSGDGLSKKQYMPGTIPVYGGNGVNGYHNSSNVEEGTLVIGRVGYYCGNVKKTTEAAWVTDNALIVNFKIEANPDFYLYILNGMNLGKKTNQTAQPVITGKLLKPMLVPVPPLEEQQRIVTKIEELFKQVEALKA